MYHFCKVQTLSRKRRNLDSNPQITISSRYNFRKGSPTPKIDRGNQQEVIHTVLIQYQSKKKILATMILKLKLVTSHVTTQVKKPLKTPL